MVTIWCSRKSNGARLLVNKINELGHEARLVVGVQRPTDALWWGQGGGNKFLELQAFERAGLPVPEHGRTMTAEGTWLMRSFNHMCANDLRRGTGRDFYVKKLDIDKEF